MHVLHLCHPQFVLTDTCWDIVFASQVLAQGLQGNGTKYNELIVIGISVILMSLIEPISLNCLDDTQRQELI